MTTNTKGLRVLSALELEQMLNLVTPDKAAQLTALADAVLKERSAKRTARRKARRGRAKVSGAAA